MFTELASEQLRFTYIHLGNQYSVTTPQNEYIICSFFLGHHFAGSATISEQVKENCRYMFCRFRFTGIRRTSNIVFVNSVMITTHNMSIGLIFLRQAGTSSPRRKDQFPPAASLEVMFFLVVVYRALPSVTKSRMCLSAKVRRALWL